MKRNHLSGRVILVLFAFFAIVLVQCDQFGLYEELGSESIGSQGGALAIAPVAVTLAANASLTFSASGGAPPYLFSITSGSGTIDALTGIYSAPPGAGMASVRVTDSAEETDDAAVTVTPAGALGISPSSVGLVTNGTITFTAIGGTGPYTFSLVSGGGSIDAVSGAYTAPPTPGSATVRVTDSQGTPATADASISVSTVGVLSISPDSIVLGTGGSVDFGAFGGVAPYTFSVVSGGGSIDPATGAYTAPLVADSVTVRVTDSDSPASTDDAMVTVTAPAPDPLSISPSSIVLGTGGSVDFNAYGGVAPYTFSVVSGGGSIAPVTGVYDAPLTADSVTVRVTDSDSPASTDDAMVTVTAPTPDPLSISPGSIVLSTGGSVDFDAYGGVAPYTFSVVSGGGSIDPATGAYTAPAVAASVVVRVTDSDSPASTDDATVTVNAPAPGTLAISPSSIVLGTGGSVDFGAFGGVAPYTFSVVSGGGSINPATGVYTAPAVAGSVVVRVSDSDSPASTDDASVTVNAPAPDPLAISPGSIVLGTGGSVDFSAFGGVAPYTFSVVSGGGSIIPATGAYTAPAVAASVVVRVSDSDSPASTDDATVTVTAPAPDPLSISPGSIALGTGGSVDFGAFGGVAPYTFSVVSGGGSIIPATGAYTAPAVAGSVTVRVSDSDSPASTDDATVTVNAPAPDPLAISPGSIVLGTGGSVDFSAFGGVAPYTFSVVSGGGSVNPATGAYTAPAVAGSVTVRVSDSDSPASTDDAMVTVNAPAPGTLTISPTSIVLGTGGSVDFGAFGGVAPYTFSVVSGGGSINPATGAYTAPAVAGSVTVRVTDSDSPASTDDAAVTVNAPAPSALAISPTLISLFTNSTADFGATGGVPPYTFSLAAGSGSVNAGTGVFTAPSTAGTSTIRVTDSDSPPTQTDATATVYEPLRIAPESVSLSVGSSFSFSATGGKMPYVFSVVSGGGSINAATGMYSAPAAPGSVVVRVTDDRMNTRDSAVTVTAVQPLVISPSSTTLLAGDSVSFTAIGGTSPYTFSVLAPADGSINSATGEYTAPGSSATDIIRVTDALSNTSDATVTVVGAGPLSISPDTATVPVNGQRLFSASGGAPPYSFAVTAGPGSINASSGLYSAPSFTGAVTVRVTDSLLNTDNAAVTVAGAVCGQTISESEPNDSTGPPWTNVDETGIDLVPGCTVTITGMTDADGDSDVFKFEKGSANFVTFIATWNTGDNELDFQLYNSIGTKIAESDSSDADSESMTWAVDGSAFTTRYLEIEPKGSGSVNYTLIISAN